jgi:hypothetical protein
VKYEGAEGAACWIRSCLEDLARYPAPAPVLLLLRDGARGTAS